MALLMASIILLTATSISASAFAIKSSPQQQSTEPGSISGTVRTLIRDEPVPDAKVFWGGIEVADGRIDLAVGMVTTDENGHYIIDGLEAGYYGLFVMKSGYLPGAAVVQLHQGEDRICDIRVAKLKNE